MPGEHDTPSDPDAVEAALAAGDPAPPAGPAGGAADPADPAGRAADAAGPATRAAGQATQADPAADTGGAGEPVAGDGPDAPRARHRLVGFIVVLAVVSVAYRLVYTTGLSRTAALYVGVPTVMAIALARLPRSRSATMMLVRGSMLVLLIAGIVTPEGLICLAIAMPLVLLVAVIAGTAIDAARRSGKREGPALTLVAVPLLLWSLEGVVGSPFDTREAVTRSVTLAATPAQVEAAVAATPAFAAELPPFLTFGFNRPVAATGAGLGLGDGRVIEFTGGTHDHHPLRLWGGTGERGVDHHSHMHLRVAEAAPGRVVFEVIEDTTMLSRWTDLDRAVVTWAPDGDGTRVTWRLEYRRLIYPTAYFGPLQRYGMGEAAGYLLDAVVTDPLR